MAKEIKCEDPCKFRLRTENESELVEMTKNHMKNIHKVGVSREDILKLAKESKEPMSKKI